MKKEYTISELEVKTGLSRRTIRFYVSEGLVPPPQGAGVAASYTEEHLLRLKVIVKLKKAHFTLPGIKDFLVNSSTDKLKQIIRGGNAESTNQKIQMISRIRAFSEPGYGSKVCFSLPLQESDPDIKGEPEGEADAGENDELHEFKDGYLVGKVLLDSDTDIQDQEAFTLNEPQFMYKAPESEEREDEPEKILKIKVTEGFEILIKEEAYRRHKNLIEWFIKKIK